jgi:hypothetical protein
MPVHAQRQPIESSFTTTGASEPFTTREGFNMSLPGFGEATVVLQRSFNEGSTWKNVESFEGDTERRVDDPEAGVWYRLNCTSFTSGPIEYRLSSG